MKAYLLLLALLHLLVMVAAARNFYEVLGVSQDASDTEIKRVYRKKAAQLHPDKNPNNPEVHKQFDELKRAYEVLSDPEKRQTYDLDGEEGLDRPAQQQQQWNPFADLFGMGQQQQQGGKPKGQSTTAEAEVTLEDLYNGVTKPLRLAKNVICSKCRGSGARDGKQKTCTTCHGQGVVMKMQQLAPGFNIQTQDTCHVCGGRGKMPVSSCPVCNGKKVVHQDKTLDLVIERGMQDGQQIVFEKEGEQSPGIIPGDVIVKLKTRKHPLFTRSGDDLHCEMSITLKEALLGFKRRLPHLDTHGVRVESAGVTQPNEIRVFKGEGMPRHSVPSEKGDLYVKFIVRMPSALTPDQQAQIKTLLSE